jgi:hypothetical protein
MKGYDPRCQVKQYVGVITNARGASWMVFETGDGKFYLFSQLHPGTLNATGLQFPVRKADLQPDVAKCLRHGMSYDARGVR